MSATEDSSAKAAAATLLVLEALVDPEHRAKAYQVGEARATLAKKPEVIALIASLPKPLECSARLAGDRLHLRCAEPSPEILVLLNDRRIEIDNGTGFLGRIRTSYLGTEDARVLLTSVAGEMVLASRDLRYWFENYFIIGDVSFSGRLPAPGEQKHGVVFTIETSRVSDYTGPIPPMDPF